MFSGSLYHIICLIVTEYSSNKRLFILPGNGATPHGKLCVSAVKIGCSRSSCSCNDDAIERKIEGRYK